METQPSGIRVSFTTRATTVELHLHPTRVAYIGFERDRGAVDVFVDSHLHARHALTGGDLYEIDMATGTGRLVAGEDEVIRIAGLPGRDAHVEIWLPHNEHVDLVGLRSDAPLEPLDDTRPLWLHHGSSISQGSNAIAPSLIWPAVAARLGDVRLHNLGFGGSAMVDPFLARVMRDTPADLISIKLGINVVNLDAMRARSLVPAVHGFLDTVREGHPTTPLLLVSPIFSGIHERTPGPGSVDPRSARSGGLRFIATGNPDDVVRGRLTLEVIRGLFEQIVGARSDDAHLHLLDGRELYGREDAERLPLPDGLHPDTETHDLIARRFAARAFGGDGPLSRSRATTT